MQDGLENLKTIAEGVSKLFQPFVEVVIHNLDKNKISYLAGTFSSRKVGDSSYLSKADRSLPPGVHGPYTSTNSSGKALKSMSIVPASGEGVRYMICINFDITELQAAQGVLGALTSLSSLQPLKKIFDENWQDKIHSFIHETLKTRGLLLNQLSRDDKKELVLQLRNKGAFKGKNSASYIAQVLNVSRASIYGYLKEES